MSADAKARYVWTMKKLIAEGKRVGFGRSDEYAATLEAHWQDMTHEERMDAAEQFGAGPWVKFLIDEWSAYVFYEHAASRLREPSGWEDPPQDNASRHDA